MRQRELAELLGISKSYLSMILSGQRRATPELAGRLKEYNSQLPVKFRYRLISYTEKVRGSSPLSPTILYGRQNS